MCYLILRKLLVLVMGAVVFGLFYVVLYFLYTKGEGFWWYNRWFICFTFQVGKLIERCLQLHMNHEEVLETLLVHAKIEPSITHYGNAKLENYFLWHEWNFPVFSCFKVAGDRLMYSTRMSWITNFFIFWYFFFRRHDC